MAVTYTNMTDGQLVSDFATNLNAFGNAVEDNITTIETDINALELNKISAVDVGMLYLTNASGVVASLTTAYSKVEMVDTVTIDESNTHMTYSTTTHSLTFVSAGIYKLTFSGSMTAPNGSVVTFNYNLNGSSIVANPPEFVGAGTKPIAIESHAVISVTSGTVLYIEAKADSAVSMTPQSCSFIIDKTHY